MPKKISSEGNIASVMLAESAAPASPASGFFQVYAKTDGKLYCKNDAGTEVCLSDTVATDPIWDAKGDLSVGTGANTAQKLTAGANSTLLMAESGETTGLKWLLTQFCKATKSGDTSANDATWTTVPLDTETYDTDTMHDLITNNSRITCKTAGTYLMIGLVSFAVNATGDRYSCFRFNDTTDFSKSGGIPGDAIVITRSICIDIRTLAVNDWIELRGYQTSGGALNINNESYLILIRIPGT